MILHLLQVEQSDNPAIDDCLSCVCMEDTVVVINSMSHKDLNQLVFKFAEANLTISILQTDNSLLNEQAKEALIKSRFKDFRPAIHGLKALEFFEPGLNQSFPNIEYIDYAQLVNLTCTHSKTISWY